MAYEAFRPNTSSFLPKALSVRATGFTMVVMNKNNGAIVYQTSDASRPWDGKDQNTGENVATDVYVWKVVLSNPLPNEKNIYQGLVNVIF